MSIDSEFNETEKEAPKVMNPGGKSAARAGGMTDKEFDELVAGAFERIPEKFREKVKNIPLRIEDEPSTGSPQTTLPHALTVYRKQILAAAAQEADADFDWGPPTERMKGRIRDMIRDVMWHDIAHHFAMDEYEADAREMEDTNELTT